MQREMLTESRPAHVCQYGKIVNRIRGTATIDIRKPYVIVIARIICEDRNAEADK